MSSQQLQKGERPAAERGHAKTPLGGLHIGRVFGVDISLDVTLLIVFFLVATSLGAGTLPRWHPNWSPGLVWTVALGAAVLFFVSVLVHELSHALVAKAQGTQVRGITLFMLGGVAQIEDEPSTPAREFAMAIVGPLTSIVIGVVCTALGSHLAGRAATFADAHGAEDALRHVGPLGTLLLWLGPINLVLGVFNLVPGFPLDGGRVLRSILWALTKDQVRASRWAAFVGQLFGWGLTAIGILMAFGSVFPVVGGGVVQGIWFVLLGFYLSSAARASIERVLAKGALEGVPVRALMLTRFDAVDADLTLDEFVNDHLLGSDQTCFPVQSGGRFVGLVSLPDVRVAHGDRQARTVGSIMVPADRVETVGPDASASEALDELGRRNVDQLAVVGRDGALLGLLRRRDIVQWLSFHSGDGPGNGRHRPLSGTSWRESSARP